MRTSVREGRTCSGKRDRAPACAGGGWLGRPADVRGEGFPTDLTCSGATGLVVAGTPACRTSQAGGIGRPAIWRAMSRSLTLLRMDAETSMSNAWSLVSLLWARRMPMASPIT